MHLTTTTYYIADNSRYSSLSACINRLPFSLLLGQAFFLPYIKYTMVQSEFKTEWDNYPQEIYDKLRELGWHINIVDGEVVSAMCPNAEYIYSYDKEAKIPLRIYSKPKETIGLRHSVLQNDKPSKPKSHNRIETLLDIIDKTI